MSTDAGTATEPAAAAAPAPDGVSPATTVPTAGTVSTAADDSVAAAGPPPVDPDERLRLLSRQGRLAVEYPLVGRLLAELAGLPEQSAATTGHLLRVGRQLARIGPDAVLAEHPELPVVTVAVTGHGTLWDVVPALTAELARHGMLLRPHVGGFNSYVVDLAEPSSGLHSNRPDIVACLLTPEMVFEEVAVPWRPEDVARVLTDKVRLLDQLAATFARHSPATLVFNTLPLLRQYTAQLVDARSRARFGVLWREGNAELLRLPERHPNVVVVDLDPLVTAKGAASDPRHSRYAQAHLAPGLLGEYARELGHLARATTGRSRKCLVVDLDETLWGGVLGEVGPDGVELATGHRGEAFSAFQRVVLQLASQGVLLAAVSKNDLEPVRQVLREHPGMVLREEHFVRVTANWRPKHDNLVELAQALNLGVDSFVFVDDSPYETGLVRRELPQIAVVRLDAEPALHGERLLRDGWFDVRELTAEDRTRTAKYREELVRADFLDSFGSVEDYLRELGVQVSLSPAGDSDLVRVAQLTARTNQFNLTTRRLAPQQVRELAADPAWSVLGIRSADRFGDNGTVGAIFTRRDGDLVHIDNFLLSCRVFARGIEQACLAAVLRRARAEAATAVTAEYRRTTKNGAVSDFYARHGFALTADRGEVLTYRHDLANLPTTPAHVQLTETPTGAAA